MSIDYKKIYLYSETILIRKFAGIVNINEIMGSWDYIISSNLLSENQKGVINDLTNCQLNMDSEDFDMLMAYLKSKPLLRRIKLAVISDSPDKIIYPLMAEIQVKELKIKVFATLEAAVDWIIY
jgi:hypothetical protein